MRKAVACMGLVTIAVLAGARPSRADVWDTTGDDQSATTRNELVHGTDQVHDLAARSGPVADVDWYRLDQKALSSYEIIVDATSGDLGPSGPALDRVAVDGVSVLQSSVPAGAGSSRSLRFENANIVDVTDQRIRVQSVACGASCGSEDTYRIRAMETTGLIPRYNNSGTQLTIVVLQNTGVDPIDGHLTFWNIAGVQISSTPFAIPAHGGFVVNTVGIVPGSSGSITVSNTGAYGQLTGRATSVEPATGFTFDTPMVPRPVSAQGSAGGRGGAALVITPPMGDFGVVFVGGSRTISYTVRNIGAVSSGTLTTTLSGPDAAQFAVAGDACSGTSLPAGASCTLQGRFAPAAVGAKSASLAVKGTPGGAATVALTGTAVTGNPVFVTSTTTQGNLGGLPAGDAICQARAAAGGLPSGSYVAWLSTLTVDARTRLGSARGFVRTDGRAFGDAITDFLDFNRVLNTIRTDETGAFVAPDDVWTGTNSVGTVSTLNCADWTSNSPSIFGTAGSAQGGPISWTSYAFPACSTPAHLYCFRKDLNLPIVPPAPPGRVAFLTTGTFTPGGGLAAADALCAAEQGAFPGTYRAYLATTTATAASRVNLNGPAYARVDHQLVGGAAELGQFSSLESGVWQATNTTYVSGVVLSARAAWSGASSPNGLGTAASTCDDWTSTGGTGYFGDPTLASGSWFGIPVPQTCSTPHHLYCIQE
jgi:hypothetical protein